MSNITIFEFVRNYSIYDLVILLIDGNKNEDLPIPQDLLFCPKFGECKDVDALPLLKLQLGRLEAKFLLDLVFLDVKKIILIIIKKKLLSIFNE